MMCSTRPHLVRRSAFALLALSLVAGSSCATNPVTGKREFNLMSESQEIALGQEMDPQVRRELGEYRNAELQRYVSDVASQLARHSERPNLPWAFAIVDSPVVNAFALPGGYVYVTRGLLAHLNDEAELAGVLGHEIGHVTARHAAQQYSKATGAQIGLTLGSIFFPEARPATEAAGVGLSLLFLKYGRDAELEADRLGATYAAANEWNPEGVRDLLSTLGRLGEERGKRGVPGYLLTHPEPEVRVAQIGDTIAKLEASYPNAQRVDRDDYLRRIDGLLFGDDPREGVVRGSELLHPVLRFAMRFPEGWQIDNGKERVVAKSPDADVYMLLDLVQAQGSNIEDVAMRDMSRTGFRPMQGGVTTINGLTAFVGTYTGRMQQLGEIVARVAHVAVDRNVFRVAGIAPAGLYDRADDSFTRAVRSFRELSPSEASNIRPNAIALYTVRSGETWQSIAKGPSGGNVDAQRLATLNGLSANEQPRAGDRIKIVVNRRDAMTSGGVLRSSSNPSNSTSWRPKGQP
jgi:predicted Zn-dependent protease